MIRYVLLPLAIVVMAVALWFGSDHVVAEVRPTPALRPQALYHADPDHLWNRLHAALLVRVGPDGKAYGHDRLEPLLWHASDHLTEGGAADHLSEVLQEFLRDQGESAIEDPLKRAILQRDLWQVANWMARDAGKPPTQLELVARAMRRLALSPEQIARLPDNYAAAVKSKRYERRIDPGQPSRVYLPPDLFEDRGPWVCVGRTDGPTAPQHVASDNPFGNAAFLVFVKLPKGRGAGLAFVQALAAQKKPMLLPRIDPETGRTDDPTFNPETPALPRGTELALVRRMMLIDQSKRIVVSRLIESVQLRVLNVDPAAAPRELIFPMSPQQIDLGKMSVFELQLRRALLFADESGGLTDTSTLADFKTGFSTHAQDRFTQQPATNGKQSDFPQAAQVFSGRYACVACHRSPTIYGTMSFQRYSPASERLSETSPPLFPVAAMTASQVEQAAARWAAAQKSWLVIKKAME